MQRGVLVAAGAGLAYAVLSQPFAGGLVQFLSILPLFAVGLALGPASAGLAAAIGAVGMLLAGQLHGPLAVGIDPGALVWNGLAAVIISRQALLSRPLPEAGRTGVEWYPASHLLVWLTGLGLFGLVLFVGAPGGLAGGGVEREFVESAALLAGPDADPDIRDGLRQAAQMVVPAVWAMRLMVAALVNAALAQALLTRSGLALRPSPAYAETELPAKAGNVFAVGLGVALVAALTLEGAAGEFGLCALIVLTIPFLLVGLAVVHMVVRRWPARWLLLTVFYVVAAMSGWFWPLVVVLGLVEHWVGVRRRIASRPSRGEE